MVFIILVTNEKNKCHQYELPDSPHLLKMEKLIVLISWMGQPQSG